MLSSGLNNRAIKLVWIVDKMAIENHLLSDERKDSDASKKERPTGIYHLLDLFDELYDEAIKNESDSNIY